jgi:AhpD family alkylhydroperoxidase
VSLFLDRAGVPRATNQGDHAMDRTILSTAALLLTALFLQPAWAAAQPDSGRVQSHLEKHVRYPASRAEVLAACAATSEFSNAEKKWFTERLPEGNYRSAGEVLIRIEAESAFKEMRAGLGTVPAFLKAVPEEGVPGAWEQVKGFVLNPGTALDGKTKELISLAVSAQIPCQYCVYFHTETSKLNGATERELREAVAMAGITRQWSTILNGVQTDEGSFKEETNGILAYAAKGAPAGEPIAVVDAASAARDMERTLGRVPSFIGKFPEPGVAGAWRMTKSIQLNPSTALSGKVKELVGLAVSAQIPCKYCTYFHTEAAKLNGATEVEIREALACAAGTRMFSTVLNGNQIDLASFKRETDSIVRHVRRAAHPGKKLASE